MGTWLQLHWMKSSQKILVVALGSIVLGIALGLSLPKGGTQEDGAGEPELGRETQAQNEEAGLPSRVAVAALGRVEPRGGVIRLSTPTSLEAVKVEQLLVDVGDRLEAGQLVAILDGVDRLQADLDVAQSAARIAEARLVQVLAGEEAGDVDAQRAEIARLEAELHNAQAEYERYEALYDSRAISTSELDGKRLIMSTTRAQLDRARASLTSVARVRPEDVAVAEAELENARDTVARAEAEMELAYVRSPLDAEVLAVHTRAGEALSPNGIVDLGQTEQMSVVAEVDQTYIDVVDIGQPVTVRSSLFEGELTGEVERISSLIGKNNLIDTDPSADEDSRVVEVRILLDGDASNVVSRLSNLQVDVSIDITSANADSGNRIAS